MNLRQIIALAGLAAAVLGVLKGLQTTCRQLAYRGVNDADEEETH